MDALRRENLERLVSWKLTSELKLFQSKMLMGTKEDIYNSSFEIDTKIVLYEVFVSLIPILNEKSLQKCLETSRFLEFLYQRWMHTPDSQTDEIQQMIWNAVRQLELNIA